jgi:hypothetical protein
MQSQCEKANELAYTASEAKRNGDLTTALNAHTEAAKLFRDAAVRAQKGDGAFYNMTSTEWVHSDLVMAHYASLCP